MGLVTRVVSNKSAEANTEAALAAIHKEFQTLLDMGAFVLEEVEEWNDVSRHTPQAEMVFGHMLLGCKHDEMPAEYQKYKRRFVALGNRVFNMFGQTFEEEISHHVPASLGSARFGIAYSCLLVESHSTETWRAPT